MKTFVFSALALVFLVIGVLAATGLPTGRVTIRVLGEDSLPVEGADVYIGFKVPNIRDFVNVDTPVTGKSDAAGRFSASHSTDSTIDLQVKKKGYYVSLGSHTFREAKRGRWQPDNPTIDVVLRRVVNPVPMFAKQVAMEIPENNRDLGFDFVVGDWTAPHGAGIKADVVFYLEREWKNRSDFSATLKTRFPNKGDGMLLTKMDVRFGSVFKLPRTAPESGYFNEALTYIKSKPDHPIELNYEDSNSWIFRVRTVLNEAGKVESALYGKIRGPIKIDPINSSTAWVIMTYYLNPDGTPNLEFDGSRNLFENLKAAENVFAP
jgi:hypothetical protein